jgi:cellulose synthase/poly-beta-1,6-N-acetylglucosamine synthase-like glycosyltransferase
VFLLAASYAVAIVILSAFGLNQLVLAVQHVRASRLPAGAAADALPEAALPAVTVQLPLFNERYVAARLIDACAGLDYPADRLEIQVLDDSTDDTVDVVAARVAHWRQRGIDVRHVRRQDRRGFKAGALAAGLETAAGEFVAVFDADFIPAPDFLRRTVPAFADPTVGLVQARWSHTNAGHSLLTGAQAALLDTHFLVEQTGRAGAGWFFSFNGTAGVWRRICIDEAGGWQADTLTEDLDLSYRAQLAGWRFRFMPEVDVPADLPETAGAWRNQQFRWTKGTAETALKLAGRLWRAPLPLPVRLQGLLHLGGFVVYPAVLVAAVAHAPLLAAYTMGRGISDTFLAFTGIGVFALAGMVAAHVLTQRALHPGWRRRMAHFPWWLAASIGLAASNTRAVAEAMLSRKTPFERTPKGGYASRSGFLPTEALLAVYAGAGLVGLVAVGAWVAVPFQILFVVAFVVAAGYDRFVPGSVA